MKYLATADLHLTDRPVDAYRWDIFPWLLIRAKAKGVDAIFLAGDLTDAKDGHRSRLVNRVVEEVLALAAVAPVYIVKGNHDYVDESQPYFGFLNDYPRVTFATTPQSVGDGVFLLPHSNTLAADVKKHSKALAEARLVVYHQALLGATAAGGHGVDGVSPTVLTRAAPRATIIGGDIHVPQRVGGCIYTGSPHPINFNDDHQPRVLYHDGRKLRSIRRVAIRKVSLTVEDLDDLPNDLADGDQLRVVYRLPRSEFAQWEHHKAQVAQWAQERGVLLRGVELAAAAQDLPTPQAAPTWSPRETLVSYCEDRDVPEFYQAIGEQLL